MGAVVADASFPIDALLDGRSFGTLESMVSRGDDLNVLHLTDLEVASTLRRMAGAGVLTDRLGLQVVEQYARLPLSRHPHTPLLNRVFELRHNFTAYDAAYVALTERLGATLVARDLRLRRALERHHADLLHPGLPAKS